MRTFIIYSEFEPPFLVDEAATIPQAVTQFEGEGGTVHEITKVFEVTATTEWKRSEVWTPIGKKK